MRLLARSFCVRQVAFSFGFAAPFAAIQAVTNLRVRGDRWSVRLILHSAMNRCEFMAVCVDVAFECSFRARCPFMGTGQLWAVSWNKGCLARLAHGDVFISDFITDVLCTIRGPSVLT